MRLWHQSLIPYLDRQHLLGQHRECCALRGKGWGRKHATVDYVFKYPFTRLYAYHMLVMTEMQNRGYNVNLDWMGINFKRTDRLPYGSKEGFEQMKTEMEDLENLKTDASIYPEHDQAYLVECINLLKQKNAPMDFEKIEKELLK